MLFRSPLTIQSTIETVSLDSNSPLSDSILSIYMPPIASPSTSASSSQLLDHKAASPSRPSTDETVKKCLDYSNDPCREAYKLIVRKPLPYNAEPHLEDLVQSVETPRKHLFVRLHGPVPDLDGDDHPVVFEGMYQWPNFVDFIPI